MADQTHNAGVHTHVDENGNVITHCHDGEVHMHEHDHAHSHGHGHTHTHTQTKAVINRLARAIGHLESVKRMVEDGRDCAEVLIQIAAVRAAIENTGKVILQDHIQHQSSPPPCGGGLLCFRHSKKGRIQSGCVLFRTNQCCTFSTERTEPVIWSTVTT